MGNMEPIACLTQFTVFCTVKSFYQVGSVHQHKKKQCQLLFKGFQKYFMSCVGNTIMAAAVAQEMNE